MAQTKALLYTALLEWEEPSNLRHRPEKLLSAVRGILVLGLLGFTLGALCYFQDMDKKSWHLG